MALSRLFLRVAARLGALVVQHVAVARCRARELGVALRAVGLRRRA